MVSPIRPGTVSAFLTGELTPTSGPLHMLFLLPGTWNSPPSSRMAPSHPPGLNQNVSFFDYFI